MSSAAITILDEANLRSAIREETSLALEGALRIAIRQATSKPYLTNAEVAELTGWSKRQLANKRANGSLPYIKRGRTIWYRASDVYAWLEQGYVPGKGAA